MAPKKAGQSAAKDKDSNVQAGDTKVSQSDASSDVSHAGKKRKNEDEGAKLPPKASRRSGRQTGAQNVDSVELMNFLLSKDAEHLCRPTNETEDIETRGSDIRTYASGIFTPFEELICALILSRPISHALGLRSIRTLLNEPYDLSTPKAIRAAGKDGVWEALDKARTQHKGKTAEEIFLLAESLEQHLGKDADDVNLQKLRDEAGNDAGKERDALKAHVKGLAKTGIDIFTRRIQTAWDEFYPFADDRVLQGMEKLGLPPDAQSLVDLIDKRWERLEKGNVAGTESEKKRKVFSRVLERALAADLEGNTDDVKKAIETK